MDKRIFKYELEVRDEQYIPLSPRASVLSVQVQRDKLVLWALVDVHAIRNDDRRLVYVIGTGNPIRPTLEGMEFAGTAQMFEGSLVWHVFIEKGI